MVDYQETTRSKKAFDRPIDHIYVAMYREEHVCLLTSVLPCVST